MTNYVRFENGIMANKAELNIESEAAEVDCNCSTQAEEVSKRFLQSSVLLPPKEFLVWQLEINTDNARSFVFSSSGVTVTEEDFNWIFDKCAIANVDSLAEPRNIFEDNRRVYSLSSIKGSSTNISSFRRNIEDMLFDYDHGMSSYDYFKSLFSMLAEEDAIAQLVVGAACWNFLGHGYFLISLPKEMTLRLRTLLSLAFPQMTAVELSEKRDNNPQIGALTDENILESMTSFLSAFILKSKKDEFEKQEYEISEDELFMDDEEPVKDANTEYTPIEDLELSVRSYNCLKRAGILSLEQLRRMTDDELRKVRNLGMKSFAEIKQLLDEKQVTPIAVPCKAKTYMDKLNELVGLDEVKDQVRKITAFAKMNQDMLASGKDTLPITLNMEFVGNPGTAKTTVARIVAGIFYESGLLSENGLVEVGRADLVGKYEGQTAAKVKDVFQKASGKVLFIDEAYSLVENWEGAYGDEAISTIVQEMENRRNETIVIFAGYPDKMESFFARNPGFRSRVPFRIHFKDYSTADLVKIVNYEAGNRGFTIDEHAKDKILSICGKVAGKAEAGNGRFCRNLVENAILEYAARVYDCNVQDELVKWSLLPDDFSIPTAAVMEGKKSNPIGFRI